jgi:hypothetical protein
VVILGKYHDFAQNTLIFCFSEIYITYLKLFYLSELEIKLIIYGVKALMDVPKI